MIDHPTPREPDPTTVTQEGERMVLLCELCRWRVDISLPIPILGPGCGRGGVGR
jgi:hypothetical protein